MPLYEYRCETCENTFELLRAMKDADSNVVCPACHSDKVERLLSTFAAGSCGRSGSRGFT